MAAMAKRKEAASALALLIGDRSSFAHWALEVAGWPHATQNASPSPLVSPDLVAAALTAVAACKGPRFSFRNAVLLLASGKDDAGVASDAIAAAKATVASLDAGAALKMKKGNPRLLRCAALYIMAVASVGSGQGVSKDLRELVAEGVTGDKGEADLPLDFPSRVCRVCATNSDDTANDSRSGQAVCSGCHPFASCATRAHLWAREREW